MERSFRDKRNNKNKNILIELPIVFLVYVITVLILLITLDRNVVFAKSITYNYNQDIIKDIFGIKNVNINIPQKVIHVKKDDTIKSYLTNTSTVEEFLKEAGIKLNNNQYTEPNLQTPILSNINIRVYTITKKIEIKVIDIPFKSRIEYSDEIDEGTKIIKQEGTVGTKEVVMEHTYIDNEKVEEKIIKERIITQPKDRIEINGNKKIGIQDCNYWDGIINKYVSKTTNPTKNIWMKYIMRKETWCDSGQNTRDTYFGLYQFLPNTFSRNGGVNIMDGEDQIRIVSKMYDSCQQTQWGASYRSDTNQKSFQTEFPELYKEIEEKCAR